MKKLQFYIDISAPIEKVYDIMLGIRQKATYEAWTAEFNPTSTYEGSWEKGSKMLFLGTDEHGDKGGMVSEIAENLINQFISIRHYGLVQGNEEITEGPDVDKWANGFENYTFQAKGEFTSVTVDLDTTEEFVEYMNDKYPGALQKLKELCEQ